MSFRKLETKKDGKIYIIEEDMPAVGAYLLVMENDNCINDYLQNSVEDCMSFAHEEFNIPINSWILR